MSIEGMLMYYLLDGGISFLMGLVLGVVLRRAFLYLVALIITIGMATLYFEWRKVLIISFDTVNSSIQVNPNQYSAFLLIIFIIGAIVGFIMAKKSKKKVKTEITELD